MGVAIVAASVLVGSRVLAAADDTVAVWVVAGDTAPGETLTPDDLVTERVRFADADSLTHYFTVDDVLPADLRLLRGLGAGELLPRAAIGVDETTGMVEISLPVSPLLLPPSVDSGSVVDIYLSDRSATATAPGRRAEAAAPSAPALREVLVVDSPPADATFAASGDRQVVLSVAAEAVAAFYGVMDSLGDPVVTVVRHG